MRATGRIAVLIAWTLAVLSVASGRPGTTAPARPNPDLRQQPHNGVVQLWAAGAGRLRSSFRTPAGVTDLAVTAGGKQVVTCDGRVRLWEARSGQLLRTFPALDGWAGLIALSPDGSAAACVGNSGRSRTTSRAGLCRMSDGVLLHDLVFEHAEESFDLQAVAFAPDGHSFLLGGTRTAGGALEGLLQLRAVSTGRIVRELPARHHQVYAAAFSPDGRYLLTGGAPRQELPRIVEWGDPVHEMGEVILWDLATGQVSARVTLRPEAITSVAFSPDARVAATAGWDGSVRLWEVAGGGKGLRLQRVLTPGGSACHSLSVALSPDGRLLVAAGGWLRDDGVHEETHIWDAATGVLRHMLEMDERVRCLAFTPDGATFLTGGGVFNDGPIPFVAAPGGQPREGVDRPPRPPHAPPPPPPAAGVR